MRGPSALGKLSCQEKDRLVLLRDIDCAMIALFVLSILFSNENGTLYRDYRPSRYPVRRSGWVSLYKHRYKKPNSALEMKRKISANFTTVSIIALEHLDRELHRGWLKKSPNRYKGKTPLMTSSGATDNAFSSYQGNSRLCA